MNINIMLTHIHTYTHKHTHACMHEHTHTNQGRSQEFQKGVSINGRKSWDQQFQMLTSHTHVYFEFNTFLPNKLASEQFHIA